MSTAIAATAGAQIATKPRIKRSAPSRKKRRQCSAQALEMARFMSPPASARVLEGAHRLHVVAGGAVQDELAALLPELADGNRDVVLGDPEESARPDDRVRHRQVRRDDDVVDRADLLAAIVEDRLAEHLFPGAPAQGDGAQLRGLDAEERGARDLRERSGG